MVNRMNENKHNHPFYIGPFILQSMAKPIEPTPTLYGKDAVRFWREVLREQKHPSPARLKLLDEAAKIKFKVKV